MMPIRVCHIIPDLKVGGVQRLLLDLIPRLRNHGIECSLSCAVRGGILESSAREIGVKVDILDNRENIPRTLGWLHPRSLGRMGIHLSRISPDIVQTHLFPAATIGRVAALPFRSTRIVETLHNTYTWKNKETIPLFIDRVLAKITNKFVCNSQPVATFSEKQLRIPTNKICVILPGIDIRHFSQEINQIGSRDRYGLAPSHIVLGCVARLVPQKRIHDSLHVLRFLLSERPNLRLLVVGDGEQLQTLRSKAQYLGISEFVRFVGTQQDMPSCYACMDIFLQLAEREGFGLAIAEAMACGVPVVAAQAGGVSEVVEDGVTGFLVPVGGIAEIVTILRKLLADAGLCRRVSGTAKTVVTRRFSIERVAEDYSHFYTSLAQEC